MGIYFCTEDKKDYVVVVKNYVPKDGRVVIKAAEKGSLSSVFLSAEDAKRLVEELNQLLMEGKGNE